MGKINKAWHEANKMPKNPTLEEKIRWREGHAKNCQCRDSKAYLLKLRAEKTNEA
jgi:hypothetical protein